MAYSVTNKFDVSGSFVQNRTKRSPELMRRNPFPKSILGVFPDDVCHGPGADSTTHGRNKQSVALFVSEDLLKVKQPVFKLVLKSFRKNILVRLMSFVNDGQSPGFPSLELQGLVKS